MFKFYYDCGFFKVKIVGFYEVMFVVGLELSFVEWLQCWEDWEEVMIIIWVECVDFFLVWDRVLLVHVI